MDDWNLSDLMGGNDPEADGAVELIGPFIEEHKITVGGYVAPHLRAVLQSGTEDVWTICCDGRFLMEAPDAEVKRWLWFVANAMAVAAGYTNHGKGARPQNLYEVQMSRIEFVDHDGGDA